MNEHMTPQEIEAMLAGHASGPDMDRWLDHMENCEACLAMVNRVWPLSGWSDSIPPLAATQAGNLENRIIDRIHTFEVGKQSLRLALIGPIILLRGMFGPKSRRR